MSSKKRQYSKPPTVHKKTPRPTTKKTPLGDSELLHFKEDGITPYTGWKWVPAKGWGGADTGVWSYINKGVVEQPTWNTASDGSPFSRGGAGVYENILLGLGYIGKKGWDFVKEGAVGYYNHQVEQAKSMSDLTESLVVQPLQDLGKGITPSAEGPGISIKEVEERKQEEVINNANEVRLRWGK